MLSSQKTVAMISEMIHTASLVHDDVVDSAKTRRGKVSVQSSWGQKNVRIGLLFVTITMVCISPSSVLFSG